MGRYKHMMMEMEDQGYDLSGKMVSPDCFDDVNLRKRLSKFGIDGICTYSHQKGIVVPMEDVVGFINKYLLRYYDDPGQCDLYLASSFLDKGEEKDKDSLLDSFGPYLTTKGCEKYDNTEEFLESIGLQTDYDELNQDLIEAIGDHWWIEREPFVISLGDELSMKWKHFSSSVMHRQRFTFLANQEFNGEPEHTDNGLFDILTELGGIINKHGLCKELRAEETMLYRARPLSRKVEHKFEEITSPPDDAAKQNRMSPAGVSMFYGAFDLDTSLKESSWNGDGKGWFLTGEFKPLRPLKVLDLTSLPGPITFWLEGFEEVAFLKSFHKEITRHINRDDSIHVEYIPSQVFTEYLRFMFKTVPLDGMIYNSSLTGAKNIVLFCNNEESKELLVATDIDEVDNRCWPKRTFCK